jgi:hypothetical protein
VTRRLFPGLSLLLLTAQAPAPAPFPGEITVTADPLREAAVREAAKRHIKAVLPTPRFGQYSRWNAAVCPKVSGIDDRLAARVAGKLRAEAATAGAKVGKPDCKPNIVILFTTGAAAVATSILAKRADAAALIEAGDRDAIRKAPLPIRWWSAIRLEDENGRVATSTSTALATATGSGEAPFEPPTGPEAVFIDSYSSSIVNTHRQVSASATTVLVDVDLATGYTLDAVSAYVAMAVLAQARLRGEVDPELTILGLFRTPAVDARSDLTVWDRAFLKALYNTASNRPARRQQGAIASAIVKERLAGN